MVQWKMAPYPVVMSQWPPSRPLPRQQFVVPSVPIDSATPLQETMVVISKVGTRWFKKITNASKWLILLFHYKSIPPPNRKKKKKEKNNSIPVRRCRTRKTGGLQLLPFFGAFRFAFSTTWWIHANEETVPAQILRHWLPWEKRNTGGFWFTEIEGSTPCNMYRNMSQYCFENSDRFKSHLVGVSSILSFGIFWLLKLIILPPMTAMFLFISSSNIKKYEKSWYNNINDIASDHISS